MLADFSTPNAAPSRVLTFKPLHQLLVIVCSGRGHDGALVRDVEDRVPYRPVLGVGQVSHELVQLRGEVIPQTCRAVKAAL